MSDEYKLIKFEVGGPGGSNTYLLVDEDTKNGYIFDPGYDDPKVYQYLEDNNINLKKILLTHGHYDHIGGVQKLRDLTGAEVIISETDKDFLIDPSLNLSAYMNKIIQLDPADVVVNDGDKIEIGPDKYLTVIATPGHTPGSICFLGDGFLVSGDLIFKDSIGRTDFEGGSFPKIKESLDKICELPEKTVILPGHNDVTTIEREKKFNPFLQGV